MAPPVPMAAGAPSPAWPLAHASRRITRDFGDARVGTARSSRPGAPRYHVAEDLRAPRGTVILAPEHGTAVVIRDRFYKGTGMMLLQLDSGLVVVLGEIEPGSYEEFHVVEGSRVAKGQSLARVGWHDMLHFETYARGTRTTHQWWVGDPPPAALLNPTAYLGLAAGAVPTIRPIPAPAPTPTPTPAPTPMPAPIPDPEPIIVAPSRDAGGALLLFGLVIAAAALG